MDLETLRTIVADECGADITVEERQIDGVVFSKTFVVSDKLAVVSSEAGPQGFVLYDEAKLQVAAITNDKNIKAAVSLLNGRVAVDVKPVVDLVFQWAGAGLKLYNWASDQIRIASIMSSMFSKTILRRFETEEDAVRQALRDLVCPEGRE